MRHFSEYEAIWFVDFEFNAPAGERPTPICMVAHELHSGRTIKLTQDELAGAKSPPFSTGPDTLFVAYYASAELLCFLALGWPLPSDVLDLFAEFRVATNGRATVGGAGLLGALMYFGITGIAAAEKAEMRELAIRGGPFSSEEMRALVDYCESDVDALSRLLERMMTFIDLPRALLRGAYMKAVARMEWAGVPIDVETMEILRQSWDSIKVDLILEIDTDFGVFNQEAESGVPVFSVALFEEYLRSQGLPWRRLDSGRLALDDDTFRQAARVNPQLGPLRELRHALSEMRLFTNLAVGRDGRNRCLLSPFRASSGRNQPSNAKFIFGPSCWLRSLIKPEAGISLAYLDYQQQEFAIAAALSGDEAMMQSYASGDPYLNLARLAGAVPSHGTKSSHPEQREQFKIATLALQYGMSEWGLSRSLGQSLAHARFLIESHRRAYPRFWRWSQAVVDHAILLGYLRTVFGWTTHVGWEVNPRSLANFPVQANGAEMLRIACILATERGIQVCAPVHDALLIEGPADEIDQVVAETQAAMVEAGRIVLDGYELRTDATVVRFPDRYMDPRGKAMWNKVMELLQRHAA